MNETEIAWVVHTLDEFGARWSLVGAHAVGLVTEPRATGNFDFVVEERRVRTVVDALQTEFGDHPLFKEALTRTRRVDDWNVPITEVLIVLKVLSAVSPWRSPEKRTYDLGDLRGMVRAVGRDGLDEALMMRLAALVYPRAEDAFAAMLDRIERGEPIEI